MARSTSRCSVASNPTQKIANRLVDVVDRLEDAFAAKGVASRREVRPPRRKPVDAPEGTAARAARSAGELDVDPQPWGCPWSLESADHRRSLSRSLLQSLLGVLVVRLLLFERKVLERESLAPAMRAASSTRSRKRRAEPRRCQFRVHLQLACQVDDPKTAGRPISFATNSTAPPVGQLMLDLGGLFLEFGEDLVSLVPVETHGSSPLLQLLGQQCSGKRRRDIVEDALPSLGLSLDSIPIPTDVIRSLSAGIGEDMGVAPYQLAMDAGRLLRPDRRGRPPRPRRP